MEFVVPGSTGGGGSRGRHDGTGRPSVHRLGRVLLDSKNTHSFNTHASAANGPFSMVELFDVYSPSTISLDSELFFSLRRAAIGLSAALAPAFPLAQMGLSHLHRQSFHQTPPGQELHFAAHCKSNGSGSLPGKSSCNISCKTTRTSGPPTLLQQYSLPPAWLSPVPQTLLLHGNRSISPDRASPLRLTLYCFW